MNKIKHIILLITLSIISLETFAKFDLDSVGLVTTKNSDQLREIQDLEDILNEIQEDSPHKDLLIYIHGRGRNAKDEIKMMNDLERRYDLKVIMFRWPSWSSLITRPVRNAESAARELSEMLYLLRDLKEIKPHLFHNKKMSMFFHSMGNIVLETYMKERFNNDLNDNDGSKLFDNLAMLGADVGLYNHKNWVDEINFTKRTYVAMNNKDIVLQLSNLLDWKNKLPILYRLGLGFDKRHKEDRYDIPTYLSPKAIYIDLSRSLKLDHRYFDSEKKEMIQIFGPMITGKTVSFDNIKLKHRIENGINYLID